MEHFGGKGTSMRQSVALVAIEGILNQQQQQQWQ
jgi:hypothetical protein